MKRFIVAGILVFVVVLVVTFPARIAYRWFSPPDVTLTGVTGSVWRGGAAEGLAAGAYLRDIRWRFRPASIFSGQLAFETSSNPGAGKLDAVVGIGFDRVLVLKDLSGDVPLDLVHPALSQNGIGGNLQLRFAQLQIVDGRLLAADGTIRIEGLFVPALSAAPLGTYKADVTTTADGIAGTVDDEAGVVDIEGTLSILGNGSYALLGNVAARPDAPPSIEQQLRFLGSPDARGMRPFRFEGTL